MQPRAILAAVAAATLMSVSPAHAAGYPCDSVEWIVGWGAGGGSDIFARSIAPAASDNLGVPVQVINMPGASSITAMQEVLNRPSDGCTLFSVTPDQLTNEITGLTELPWTTLTPIMRAHVDVGMLHAKAGGEIDSWEKLKNLNREVLAGGTGAASFDEIVVQLVLGEAGIPFRYVPYEKASEMHADLLGGRLEVIYDEVSVMASMHEAGQVVPLIVLAEERLERHADVPSAGEIGLGVPPALWRGVAVKAGTDETAVDMLEDAFLKAADSEAYMEFEEKRLLNLYPGRLGATEFVEVFEREHEMYSRVLKQSQ